MPMLQQAQPASPPDQIPTPPGRVRMVGDKLMLNRLDSSADTAAEEAEGAIEEVSPDELLWWRPFLHDAFFTS